MEIKNYFFSVFFLLSIAGNYAIIFYFFIRECGQLSGYIQ